MLRDFWYTACASQRLGSSPLASRVLDQEIALFRDVAGVPHAVLDRCCHRGTRLSLGTIAEGALACSYHGWRYDGSGRCVHIPSLPAGRKIPDGVQVPCYPCIAKDGYVWVWIGDADRPGDEPGIRGFGDGRWVQGAIEYRCDALRVIENNLDWCHAAFTHVGTHPQYFFFREHGFTEYSYEVRVTEDGMIVFFPPTASDEEPIPERPLVSLRFELPNRVTVDFAGPDPFTTIMHFVPTGPGTSRLEWLYTNPSPDGPAVAWSDPEPEVFAQDRRVLESAQPWYDRDGDAFERSVEADTSTLLVRKIIALASSGTWERKRSSLPQRRIVTVRS